MSLKFINPPAKVSVENADLLFSGIASIPVFGKVELPSGDWEIEGGKGGNSKSLWFHSIPFISDLQFAYEKTGQAKYAEKAAVLLASYLEWLEKKDDSHPAWRDEHATANRSRVISYVLFRSAGGQFPIPTELVQSLSEAAARHAALLFDDTRYIKNNHGLMSDRALIEVALILETHPDSATGLRRGFRGPHKWFCTF